MTTHKDPMTVQYKVGYDLDGVFATEPKWLAVMFLVWPKLAVKLRNRFTKPLYYPCTKDFCIVTGRPMCDSMLTFDWLHFNGFGRVDAYHNNNFSVAGSVLFKAEMIKELRIETYVESDPYIVELLRLLTTGVKILTVKEALDCNLLTKV